jgi:hypothetical protein
MGDSEAAEAGERERLGWAVGGVRRGRAVNRQTEAGERERKARLG